MKKHLLTGLAILLPAILTLIVIRFLFNFFTEPFVPLVSHFLHWVSGQGAPLPSPRLELFISQLLALLLITLVIFVLGLIARWFFFKNILLLAQKLLSRIPVVKTVYHVSKDLIAAIVSTDGKKAFKRPILIPFPSQETYALGFEAGEVAEEIQQKIKTPLTPVFMPTVPHPISGFLLLMPKEDLHAVDMTSEELLKYLVSCGLIHPRDR